MGYSPTLLLHSTCLTNLPTHPLSERVLMFAAHLHIQNVAHGTNKSYLAAMCHGQIVCGLGDPQTHQMPQLECLRKGIKRATPQSTRTRFSITPHVLMDLKGYGNKRMIRIKQDYCGWQPVYVFVVCWGWERLQCHQRESTITNHTCVTRMSKWIVMWSSPIFRSQ